MANTLRAPDFLWDYRCNQKGCCCRSWRIGLKEADLHRLRIAAADTPLAGRLDEAVNARRQSAFAAFIPAGAEQARFSPHAGRTVLQEDGRCAFLDAADLCEIHTEVGEEALPHICRNFPISALVTPSGEDTYWEPICPEVTRALAAAESVAHITDAPDEFTRHVDVHQPRGAVDSVRLTAGLRVPFAAYDAFRADATTLLQQHAASPLSALARIARHVQAWVATGEAPEGLADGSADPAGYTDVVLHLARMVQASADAREWLQSKVSHAPQFFQHHPWGTESTLDVVVAGALPSADAAARGWKDADERVHLVLTNYLLMKVQAVPLSNNGTLEIGYRQLLETVGTALYLAGAFAAAEGSAAPHERLASALTLADYVYRSRKEAPAVFQALGERLTPWQDGTGRLSDVARGLEVLSTDAPVLGGFRSAAETDAALDDLLSRRFGEALDRLARPVKTTLRALGKGGPCPPLSSEASAPSEHAARLARSFHARCLQTVDGHRLTAFALRTGVDPTELEVVGALMRAETRTRWARLLAHVSLDYDHRAPSRRTLEALVGARVGRALAPTGRLLRLGLVEVAATGVGQVSPDDVRYRLADSVLGWLMGNPMDTDEIPGWTRRLQGPAAGLVPPRGAALASFETCLSGLSGPALVNLTGPEGYDRVALVRLWTGRGVSAVALTDDEKAPEPRGVALVRRAVREAVLADHALVVFEEDKALNAEGVAEELAACTDLLGESVFVVSRREASRLFTTPVTTRVVSIPGCSEAYRTQVLVRALPDTVVLADAKGIRQAVRGLAIPPDLLVAAARGAAVDAVLRDAEETSARGPVPLGTARLLQAMREQLTSRIGDYADTLTVTNTWDDLQLEPESKDRLNEVVQAYQNRSTVLDRWGFRGASAGGNGMTMLFFGPPGTGKTMAAGILAAELGLEVFKVDLSRVVDKYIGETQKSLGRVFDEAERGEVLLLFDEADSLFGKRTQVTSSTDRYANLETNYLLQRMEAYDGLVVLTTNHDGHLDPAFRRRIKYQVHFPVPDFDARQGIWEGLIPERAPVAEDLDFEELAERFEMSGGHIRNAVLNAAILAATEERPIGMGHLVEGGNREYRALGKVVRSWEDDE